MMKRIAIQFPDTMRTSCILVTLLSWLAIPAESDPESGPLHRPNVVMFAVDDMCDWIGPMGYSQAVTPNMARLAKRGVTFQNAHKAVKERLAASAPATFARPGLLSKDLRLAPQGETFAWMPRTKPRAGRHRGGKQP
jgi:hypothetical protein